MSAPSLKRFRVIFVATSCYKIALEAATEREAIARARRLWRRKGEELFTAYAGDTDAWSASPE